MVEHPSTNLCIRTFKFFLTVFNLNWCGEFQDKLKTIVSTTKHNIENVQ